MSERSEALAEILARRGKAHLCEDPGAVYLELRREFVKDEDTARLARMVLHTVLAGVPEHRAMHLRDLSEYIQENCCLEAAAADCMANLYMRELPAKEYRRGGENRPWDWETEKVYAEFCEREWTFCMTQRTNWDRADRCARLVLFLDVFFTADHPGQPTQALIRLVQEEAPETADALFFLLRDQMKSALKEKFLRYVGEEMGDSPTLDAFSFDSEIDAFCASYGLVCSERRYNRYVFPRLWLDR